MPDKEVAVVVPGSGSIENRILSSTSTTGGGGGGGVGVGVDFLVHEMVKQTIIINEKAKDLLSMFKIFIKLSRFEGLPNIPWTKISICVVQGKTKNNFMGTPVHGT